MSPIRAVAALLGVALATPLAACELDGINHGIFGAWGSGARLSVLVKQHEAAAESAEITEAESVPQAEAAPPPAAAVAQTPPAPRRNFAAWARPRITASPQTAEVAQPAGWAQGASAAEPAAGPPLKIN
jgi:hypothetical protein